MGGGKIPAQLKLIDKVTTNQTKTFNVDNYERIIVMLVAAVDATDGLSNISSIKITTNGAVTKIDENLYSDSRRPFLKEICYLIEKKDEPITVTVSGTQVWGIYTTIILG